jgi:hypothetical protein
MKRGFKGIKRGFKGKKNSLTGESLQRKRAVKENSVFMNKN